MSSPTPSPGDSSRSISGRPVSPSPSYRQATARLGSPVVHHGFPSSTGNVSTGGASTPPPGGASGSNTISTGAWQNQLSALNYASGGGGSSPPRFGTPPRRLETPSVSGLADDSSKAPSVYGSVDARPPMEDAEIIRRHLVTDDDAADGEESSREDQEFNSLATQGGDITRPLYRYVESESSSYAQRGRAKSFHLPRDSPIDDSLDINSIRKVGGFRRDYLRRTHGSPSGEDDAPGFLTRNFFEFLTLHGHFAGEDLEEDDEWDVSGLFEPQEDEEAAAGEGSALLGRRPHHVRQPSRRRAKSGTQGTAGSGKAVLLLLKSFVGTGVLFLPKAYLNGGMLFSNLVLLTVAALSYYCFVLLVNTRLKIDGSFGDIGGILYGPKMRLLILASIVISQIGFAAAYIVFTSENLQAFIKAVSPENQHINVKWLILMQLVLFMPLSMIRDMAKLGWTALVADAFILGGLVYLYGFDFFTLAKNGISDVRAFNPNDWTLFIGTAIFTFEGIGLIIPIQETMKKPEKFPKVLGFVMIVITFIFVSMGAISYAAFGSHTKTVVLLNLPQGSKAVNGIQFVYSLAILLSTPLQLFPAIRIVETALFPRGSGKHDPKIKWQKNVLRFFIVFGTAMVAWGGANDLDKFVALIGSFACIPLVYIYPPLLHMRAYPGRRWGEAMEIGLCVFGFCVMTYTTALTIVKWGDGKGK